jgi:hypothetical protein
MSFDCDAAAGGVMTMGEGHLEATTALSGSLRPMLTRQDNELRSVATVKLASAKDFVALQMTPTAPNSNTFDVFVRNGDAQQEERQALGQVSLNQTMPFRIAVVGKNVVVAALGQTVTIDQMFRGKPRMGVSCSTGRFMFENVQPQ